MAANILCAHDITDGSDPALRTALDLARRLGAGRTVYFASTPPYPAARLWYALAPTFEGLGGRILAAAREELDARVNACTVPGDPPICLVVEVEDPGEGILHAVRARRPALVVLGTH